jgi:hypothetical protein
MMFGIIGWAAVGIIAYRFYKQQVTKPRVWKIVIIIFVGVFSFSINWPIGDTIIKITLLPLGVWVLYLLRGKTEQWQSYRTYAWLGFFANFIFLATTLFAILVSHYVYPKDKPLTYMANIEGASIVNTHPSAKNLTLNKRDLPELLQKVTEEPLRSEDWYGESTTEATVVSERFPYQLIGAEAKFGSDLHAAIYVENDGKGLLLQTPQSHYYFRSQQSLLLEGK